MHTPRMTVQTLSILRAMLENPSDPWYGLELAKAARLKTGTIYPMLARLERAGWLASSWEEIEPSSEGRPRRRLYRLTGEGERAARQALRDALGQLAPERAWDVPSPALRLGGSPA